MIRVAATLTALAMFAACGDDGGPATPRGVAPGRGAAPTAAHEGIVSSAVKPEDLPDEPERAAAAPTGAPAPAPGADEAPPGETAPREKKRDLGGELASRMGSPQACLTGDGAASLPASFRVRVAATVTATGIVTRAAVSGPGLTDAMRRCLSSRATGVHLSGPVENAPRSVTAEFEVKRQKSEKAPDEK